MKSLIHSLSTILLLTVSGLAIGGEQSLKMLHWGGAYEQGQQEAWFEPYEAKTGWAIDTWHPGSLGQLRADHESGEHRFDLIDGSSMTFYKGCDEGLLEPVDHLFNADHFVEGAVIECAVAVSVDGFALVTRTDSDRIQTIEDFFDPSIQADRALWKWPHLLPEMALYADGVPKEEIYATLRTQDGIDRAFEVMSRIKDQVTWYGSMSQVNQFLADEEVTAALAMTGRTIYSMEHRQLTGVEIHWDTLWIKNYGWQAVSSAAPNKTQALDYLQYVAGPANKEYSRVYYNGPTRTTPGSDQYLTDRHPDFDASNTLVEKGRFWADHNDQLKERFSAWLSR